MKRLVLILFMLPMLAFGQHHMMSVLASQPSGDWDYEGTMTVGYGQIAGVIDIYGYSVSYSCGSMSPTSPQVTGEAVTEEIFYYYFNSTHTLVVGYEDEGTGYNTCTTIEIDGVEFTGFVDGELTVESNPFPASGKTCTIKLK